MRPLRSIHLILAVMAITVLAHILVELRIAGPIIPGRIDFILSWLLIVLNFAVAVAGLWTSHRVAWIGYLILSIGSLVLIGAATPLSALLLLRIHFWG